MENESVGLVDHIKDVLQLQVDVIKTIKAKENVKTYEVSIRCRLQFCKKLLQEN